MKQQFAVTHTIRQTEIPASLLDSWFTNMPSVKMLCPQKHMCPYTFIKTCLCSDLLRIGQVSSISCKIVCGWITTNCSFMGDIV
jgi:hypothetical protein